MENKKLKKNELNSKQRAKLRALASVIEPVYIIGKDGLTANCIQGIDEAIEKRELVKIKVLKTCEKRASEMVDELADALEAIVVATIGNKMVLYRFSKTEGVKHIEF